MAPSPSETLDDLEEALSLLDTVNQFIPFDNDDTARIDALLAKYKDVLTQPRRLPS